MNLNDVINILEAKLIHGDEYLDRDIISICAGDLMSDLLACPHSHGLLITGLVNVQVIRTAEMLDLSAIVFIRGKQPSEEMIELSRKKQIALLTTEHSLYTSCGLLFEAGLRSCPLF